MSQDDSGDKTEPGTPKRLRDARRKGDVPKSRDITNTMGLAFTMVLIGLACEDSTRRVANLTLDALMFHQQTFDVHLQQLGPEAIHLLLRLSALVLLPIALFGLLVEFLQAGPVFAMEKVLPKMSHLDPVAGVGKMASLDNVVEVFKSIGKTLILFTIGYLVISSTIERILWLPTGSPLLLVEATTSLAIKLFGWTLGIFLVIMALDAGYQQHAFAKKMKMSIRDIRQEHKDSEGDPMIKGQRRQMHQEFAQQGATEAAANASVLIVNPTHVAIAIHYDKENLPVPKVMAKGEDGVARAMRDAAARHHVPVLRNVRLARTLLAQVDEGDFVPRSLFDIIAEVITWATRIRQEVLAQQGQGGFQETLDPPARHTPGEDLTDYPLGSPVSLFGTGPAGDSPEQSTAGDTHGT